VVQPAKEFHSYTTSRDTIPGRDRRLPLPLCLTAHVTRLGGWVCVSPKLSPPRCSWGGGLSVRISPAPGSAPTARKAPAQNDHNFLCRQCELLRLRRRYGRAAHAAWPRSGLLVRTLALPLRRPAEIGERVVRLTQGAIRSAAMSNGVGDEATSCGRLDVAASPTFPVVDCADRSGYLSAISGFTSLSI
jgi:hypothetical protein